MTCDECKWAEWKRTSNGRLHPDKTGKCTFVWNPPPIPKAFRFSLAYWRGDIPSLSGGLIERGENFTNGCQCFERRANEASNMSEMKHT